MNKPEIIKQSLTRIALCSTSTESDERFVRSIFRAISPTLPVTITCGMVYLPSAGQPATLQDIAALLVQQLEK